MLTRWVERPVRDCTLARHDAPADPHSSCRFVQQCLCSHIFIVAFPVLVVVSMAHASFVDLPVWRDRPPSKAFFDFNRYEYRLQLRTNWRHERYYGLRMPESSPELHERQYGPGMPEGSWERWTDQRDREFWREQEFELCAIHTGCDYIVGQTVGHHDPSGRPAWVVIWRCVTFLDGLIGKSSARVFRRLHRPYLIRELCALCRSLSMQSRALGVILIHAR